MGCKLNSNVPILHRIPTKPSGSYSSFNPRSKCGLHPVNSSTSYSKQSRQEPPTAPSLAPPSAATVKFETLKACKLGITRYPNFEYNAAGGVGTATGKESDGEISVSFNKATLYIPPLTGATTRFLGLPLPPLLKIDIVPEVFEGTINKGSGKIDLKFIAKFWFSVGSIYRAPPLVVETMLTSEESKGAIRNGRGERMDGGGRCRLVGVATIEPIQDLLMDSFLGLPTECIADINARISIS